MNLLHKTSSNNKDVIVSLDELVVEITAQEYNDRKGSVNHNAFVCAHEVAFDSKGKQSCNLSMWVTLAFVVTSHVRFQITTHLLTLSISFSRYLISWFDTPIFSCSGSLAKRQSKMAEQWNPGYTKGQKFCMPANQTFVEAYPEADPLVLMQPVDDRREGHTLMQDMIKHRVACILRQLGFRLQEIVHSLLKLSEDFCRMKKELERSRW